MKSISTFILILTIASAMLFTSCGNKPKATKTILNLKAAIKGETTASAKYAAYSLKAKEEGLAGIGILFEAASKSESIHAKNHIDVLTKLGEKMEEFKPEFTVKTTKENLEDAYKGESYEVDTMYPDFIKSAEEESVADAKTSFGWAIDTEKKHRDFYKKAIDTSVDAVASLPGEYFVCPKCGNTYDAATVQNNCDFCQTSKEKFLSIK